MSDAEPGAEKIAPVDVSADPAVAVPRPGSGPDRSAPGVGATGHHPPNVDDTSDPRAVPTPRQRPPAITRSGDRRSRRSGVRDLAGWILIAALGFGLAACAVHTGGRLGTAAAPFQGRYVWHLSPTNLLAPAVAALVLGLAATGLLGRIRWGLVLAGGWLAAFGWSVCLAATRGTAGLTVPMTGPASYRGAVLAVDDAPLSYLRQLAQHPASQPPAAREHPPGPVLLLWGLHRVGLHGDLTLALILAAAGAAAVPLVLSTVRGVCGEPAARGYLPVLALAPSAVWGAASVDGMTALLGAAMAAAGVRASARGSTGLRSAGWAGLAGLLLGLAALFSYAAPWLGVSLVCLYFARRRPLANLGTGLGALVPVVVADRLGFSWLPGLWAAHPEFAADDQPAGTVLWWSLLSLVIVLVATGPPGVASLRKIRNTPGWPFLVGAAAAVVFSVLTGLARGGAEHAWLAFFPWLALAAVAPERPGGPPVRPPLLLAGAGAVFAVALQAILLSPW